MLALWCVILVLCLYFLISVKCYTIDRKNRKSINYLLRNARHGDLVLFAGKSMGEKCIMWWTNSNTSHVGVVIEENGEKYLFEADIGQRAERGVRFIPLHQKLILWKGENTFILKKGKREPNLDKMKELLGKDIEFNHIKWFLGVKSEKVYCSEVVADVLGYENPSSITPGFFED